MSSVDRFLAQPDRSTGMIRRYADGLGVSRPMFYKLLSSRGRWMDDERPVRLPAPRRSRSPEAAAIVDEAIALCGPGAIQERVYECAVRIAAHRAVDAPGRQVVNVLYNRGGAGQALGERLGVDADVVIDASPLALRVSDRRGGHVLVVLTAVIDRGGGLLEWTATPGDAELTVVESFVARARHEAGAHGVIMSNAFQRRMHSGLGVPNVDVTTGRVVRRGAAVMAARGKRIGRIPVLPWTPSRDPTDEHPVVELQDVRDVLQVLLALSRPEADMPGPTPPEGPVRG